LANSPSGIELAKPKKRRTYSLQVGLFNTDKKGKVLGSNFWKFQGSLNEEAHNHVMTKGIPFSAAIPLKDKDQIIKIVVYDEKSGSIGSKIFKKKGRGYTLDAHPIDTPEEIKLKPGTVPPPPGAPFSSQ
jgi:hypothetical protein